MNRPVESRATVRRAKSPAVQSLQLAFLLFVIIGVGWGLWSAANGSGSGTGDRKIPHEIAGLEVTRTVTGNEALSQMSELHGKDVGLSGGFIAYYGAGSRQGVIWLGETQNVGQAQRLNEAMTARIKAGNAYFTNLQTQIIESETVFSVVDTNKQKHYYFQVQNMVVWVAAPPNNEENFVRGVIRFVSS